MTNLPDRNAEALATISAKRQQGMKHMVRASLLVTTALQPVQLAAQTLVG